MEGRTTAVPTRAASTRILLSAEAEAEDFQACCVDGILIPKDIHITSFVCRPCVLD